MPIPNGTRFGPYEIAGWLGAGGMGEVYRARDVRLERQVAIKVVPERLVADVSRLDRFRQEARAAGQLNHPNITAVYDSGVHAGMPYIVSELLEGESLALTPRGGSAASRAKRSNMPVRSRRVLPRRTTRASFIAISNRTTCSSRLTVASRFSTSGSRSCCSQTTKARQPRAARLSRE